MMGPFHIYLNAMENLISLHYPVFSQLYTHLFGRRKTLPRKPQFHRMTTILASLFGGWLLVRSDVTKIFGVCKDVEYLALRHLVDDLCPLIFYYYAIILKGSDYPMWQGAILHLTIMFIVQQRHNYNKAMLAAMSDNIYHETVIPEWKTTFSTYMNVFTEKKVEIFHSLLRMQCPSWSTADQIAEFAHVLSAKKFDSEFSTNFLSEKSRKPHRHDVAELAGRAAEFLVSKFSAIYTNLGQSEEVPQTSRRPKRRTFHFKNLDCKIDQRSLPLGYSSSHAPSQDLLCDFDNCIEEGDTALLLSCGHSFHSQCMQGTTCMYCQPFLLDAIKDLSSKFNRSMQTNRGNVDGNETEHIIDEEEDLPEEEPEDYYTTTEFRQHLRAQLQRLPSSAARPKYVSKRQKGRALGDHTYTGLC